MTPRPPQRLLNTPSWLITQIAASASRRSRDVFTAVGAGRYHYALLCALDEFGSCSQAQVGKHLGMDRKDVAFRLAELEDGGHVGRQPDPQDPRRNLVHITQRGRRHLDDIHQHLAAAQDELLADLTPAQRTELVHLLQIVLGR